MIEFLDKEKCTGCGTCIQVCPMDVFRMEVENRRSSIRYAEDCMTCFNCELECPESAIGVNPFRKERIQVW